MLAGDTFGSPAFYYAWDIKCPKFFIIYTKN